MNLASKLTVVVLSAMALAVGAPSAGHLSPDTGPVDILANGGVYTTIAHDPLPGEAEFGLIVRTDVLADAT